MEPLSSFEAMSLAIEEAKKGFGYVSPNPPVGCVILDKDGYLLSKGYHQACGKNHAEINALENLKDKNSIEGAHVFVTLEPCSFEGRTGACAKALAQLPIMTVIYGQQDPNPKVSGKGAQILKDAGKVVNQYDELQTELEELIEIFRLNMRQGVPFVAIKTATSIDGQLAMKSGESQWLTNSIAREHSHFLRACYDAVLVGRGTFDNDDPTLNVRHPQFPNFENRVVILDPQGRSVDRLKNSNVFKHHKPENIFYVTLESVIVDMPGLRHITCEALENGSFNLKILLQKLYNDGLCSIYVEGGAQTYKHFIEQNCAHRLYQFIAPTIIGGQSGRSWSEGIAIEKLEKRIQLQNSSSLSLGDNILITGLFS